ncbi:unnamed protein product [Linum trigynum]|uniref:Uncharacterized protein n=1 Tax=Linum trigynum TaxID=586398 RepID=A0AAV2CNE4_9ROSI
MEQKHTMKVSNIHVNGSIVPEVILIDDDDDTAPCGYTESPAKQLTVAATENSNDENNHPIVLGLPCPQTAMESTKKRPHNDKDVNELDRARSASRPRVTNPAPNSILLLPPRTANKGKSDKCLAMPVGKPPLPPHNLSNQQLPLSMTHESHNGDDQSDEDIAEAAKKREGGAWVREFAKELLKGAPLDLLVEKPIEMLPNPSYQDKSFHH